MKDVKLSSSERTTHKCNCENHNSILKIESALCRSSELKSCAYIIPIGEDRGGRPPLFPERLDIARNNSIFSPWVEPILRSQWMVSCFRQGPELPVRIDVSVHFPDGIRRSGERRAAGLSSVGIEGGERRFREVIPPGPRLDDVGKFLAGASGFGEGMPGFFRVQRNEFGVIDETERGYLFPGDPILESLLSRDPPPLRPPSYVPVNLIVPAELARLLQCHGKYQPVPVAWKFGNRFGR
jgi:hypothetical protein